MASLLTQARRILQGAVAFFVPMVMLVRPTPSLAQTVTRAGSDIAALRTIRDSRLSANGEWFAYLLSPHAGGGVPAGPDAESQLVLRATKSGTEMRFPMGVDGERFEFTADARWLVYLRAPNAAETRRLHQAGESARTTLVVRELATGKQVELADVQSFTLDGKRSRVVVLEPYAEPASASPTPGGSGRQVILYDLVDGTTVSLPHVGEFAFDASGRWLAWTVDAEGQRGNGLRLRDLARGRTRVLDSDRAFYRGLRWADGVSDRLAVLKGTAHAASADTLYHLLGYTGIATGAPTAFHFHPQADPAFPRGMTIGAGEPLRWSADRQAIFFGIRPVREAALPAAAGAEERADLVLWHWQDPRLQSEQRQRKARDEAYTYRAVYHLQERTFVRLADDAVPEVAVAPTDRWALGWDSEPYAREAAWRPGHYYVDLYAIDVRTGTRRLLVKRYLLRQGIEDQRKRYFFSPDGVRVLTWADGAYTVHNLATGAAHPLLRTAGPTFDADPYDYGPQHLPSSLRAWSKDGGTALLSDGWDLWAVPLDGGAPVNLTVNGKRDGVKYLGHEMGIARSYQVVDLARPWYARARSQWTKESGIVRIDGPRPGVRRVLWGEADFQAQKAEDADVVVFTRETALEPPDYYITDLTFATPRRLTDANPRPTAARWSSGTRLVDYQGPSGERLQAALLLPADYEVGKRYPAIMQIYERMSWTRNTYWPAGEGAATEVTPALYASRGYVMIFPDIHYRQGRPGTSALHCALAAARAAVAAGIVDSTRVGLAGHSMGGYETAFIATQTSFFKAALAAAPPTNFVSAYGGIAWTSGAMMAEVVEADQNRMGEPYWRNLEAYVRESPVFHVDRVTTPILLMHNDQDEAVDWHQGVELYNGLRAARKPVVMLQYVGEKHSVGRPANKRDFARRAQEFFDHFLLGAPAPKWWTDGVPYRELDRHLRERAAEEQRMTRGAGGAPGGGPYAHVVGDP